MQKVAFVAPVALLLLSACARDGTAYPSLAQRPTEKRGFAEPATPAPEPVRPDPRLDAAIATLRGQLATVGVGFDRDRARAEQAAQAARGQAVGSERWLTAQTALAALDDWRAQASALVGEAAGLATDRAAALAAPYPALGAVQPLLAAEVARQDAAIDRIQTMLPAA